VTVQLNNLRLYPSSVWVPRVATAQIACLKRNRAGDLEDILSCLLSLPLNFSLTYLAYIFRYESSPEEVVEVHFCSESHSCPSAILSDAWLASLRLGGRQDRAE
jgi:hypothetical protein